MSGCCVGGHSRQPAPALPLWPAPHHRLSTATARPGSLRSVARRRRRWARPAATPTWCPWGSGCDACVPLPHHPCMLAQGRPGDRRAGRRRRPCPAAALADRRRRLACCLARPTRAPAPCCPRPRRRPQRSPSLRRSRCLRWSGGTLASWPTRPAMGLCWTASLRRSVEGGLRGRAGSEGGRESAPLGLLLPLVARCLALQAGVPACSPPTRPCTSIDRALLSPTRPPFPPAPF